MKVYDVIVQSLEEGYDDLLDQATDFLHGFCFGECETNEEQIKYKQFVEEYQGVEMWYDYGADYYFYTEA